MPDNKIEKVVYFVRHGQSEHNIAPVFQSPDSPLSEKGKDQAKYIAHRISRLSVEKIITSPFERAKQTAEIIAKMAGKDVEYSDLFVERIKPTSINGKTHDDKKASATWYQWEESLYNPDIRVEDGENFSDISIRVNNALTFLYECTEHTLVVVTHGYFLRAIVGRVLLGDLLTGEHLKRFIRNTAMENTSITALRLHNSSEGDPIWRLWIYNDHSHLG